MIRAARPVGALVASALVLAGCGPPAPPAARHLVLVTLDTTRADRLGCYGRAEAGTPALDALAARGTRVERAYAPCPLTLPSHVSLLTGLLPPRTGVHVNGQTALAGDVETLAERLRAAGFYTAAAIGGFPLAARFPASRGFERYDDRLADPRNPSGLERPADAVVRAALALLAERGGRRTFLWVHLYDPHDPYEPPEPYRSRFAGDPYQGEIAFADAAVGDLLDGIRHTLGDDVAICVAGDHGEALGDHGEPTHGFFLYEPTVRVPLILAGPRVPEGRVLPGPLSLVDVAPTLLGLLGLDVPNGLDGAAIDLADARPATEPIYLETELPRRNYGWSALYGVVEGSTKWIDAPRPELYDLAADPAEARNLAPGTESTVAPLRAWLAEVRSDAADEPTGGTIDPRLAGLGYVGASTAPASGTDLPDPKDKVEIYALFQRAGRALEQGRYDDALDAANRLLGLEDSPGARFKRAEALARLGRLGDAASDLDRVASADPAYPGLEMERLRIALARERWEEAVRHGDAHLARVPDDAEALTFRAAARERLGDARAAERDYRAALAANPAYRDPALRLAALLVREGRVDEARVVLEARLRVAPGDGLARGLLESL